MATGTSMSVIWLAFACLFALGAAQDFEALNQQLQLKTYRDLQVSADDVVSSKLELEALRKSLSEGMKSFWFPNLESLDPQSLEFGNESRNVSEECKAGAARILNSTDAATGLPLIVRMIDAMGKPGAGYFDGNFYASGAYDECLDIGPGDAEYCTGTLNLTSKKLPLAWSYSFCVPHGCTPEDIAIAVSVVTFGLTVVNASQTRCMSTRKPPFTAGAIVMIFVCFLFACLVMGATLLDYIWQNLTKNEKYESRQIQDKSEETPLVTKPSPATKSSRRFNLEELITTFSLFKLLPQILSTKQPPSAITSINGLRVISMFWVILAHTHFIVLETGLDNIYRLEATLSRFSFQPIGNAFFAVDSFFVLSGLLVAYLTMRQMKRKNGRFPFVTYYLHRYLRLTPTYAFVLFFIWVLSMYLADGPLYSAALGVDSAIHRSCNKYWWTNLLYINNLYPWKFNDECISWSWYLANDMQFYILSPLILIPLYYFFPIGIAISALVIIKCFVITGALAGIYDHQANQLSNLAYDYSTNESDIVNYTNLLYVKPWHRVAPYIVGLILGYVLYRLRLPTSKSYVYIKYVVFSVMWILSGIFLFSTLYGLYFQWHGHVPTKFENVFYITFSRFAWSLGLAFIVCICHYGYGGIVNQFLSMNFWIPLSRLSYNAYLLHPFIILVILGSERKAFNYQDYNLVVYSIGMVVLSFGAAAVVSVFVEFPIGNLEQVIFKMAGLSRHESARTDTATNVGDNSRKGVEQSTLSNTKPSHSNKNDNV